MPVRTGLPQHLVDEIVRKIPIEYRTVAQINRTLDYHFNLIHRSKSKRCKVTNIELIELYTKKHKTMREIAAVVGVSATAVSKKLAKLGVKRTDGTWVERKCGFCSAPIKINRARARARNSENNFCNQRCHGAWVSKPTSFTWRHGSRLARVIVSRYFALDPGHIVHHKDGNEANNDLSNLMVLASASDHSRLHRSSKTIVPLWDGANQIPKS
jgi:hypothetical protein